MAGLPPKSLGPSFGNKKSGSFPWIRIHNENHWRVIAAPIFNPWVHQVIVQRSVQLLEDQVWSNESPFFWTHFCQKPSCRNQGLSRGIIWIMDPQSMICERHQGSSYTPRKLTARYPKMMVWKRQLPFKNGNSWYQFRSISGVLMNHWTLQPRLRWRVDACARAAKTAGLEEEKCCMVFSERWREFREDSQIWVFPKIGVPPNHPF